MRSLLTVIFFLLVLCGPLASQSQKSETQTQRTRSFQPTSVDIFKQFALGDPQLDISVRREILFDVQVNLQTAVLQGAWRDVPKVSVPLFDVVNANHFVDAEVLVARP